MKIFVGHKGTKPHTIPTSIRRPSLDYGHFSWTLGHQTSCNSYFFNEDNFSMWTPGCVFPSIVRTSLYYGHSVILPSQSFYASLTNNFTRENISLILIDASREKFLSPLTVLPVFRWQTCPLCLQIRYSWKTCQLYGANRERGHGRLFKVCTR